MTTENVCCGNRGDYAWVDLGEDYSAAALVTAVPELLLGRRLVAVALDCGGYVPSDRELRLGWSSYGTPTAADPGRDEEGWSLPSLAGVVSTSPVVASFSVVERFLAAFCSKEFYVLGPGASSPEERCPTLEIFSNLVGVPPGIPARVDVDEDRFFARMVERFWLQLLVLDAESYLCDREGGLILVSRRPGLTERAPAIMAGRPR